ncbi:MAG TPA: hypothetical protein VF695_00110 [Sphingomonas sp.]
MRYSAILDRLRHAAALILIPLAGCALSPGATTPALGGGQAELRDPLIGLTWSPARVRFADAPADLTTRCPGLANARYDQKLWVFAQAPQGDAQVMIVAGQFVARSAADPAITNDYGTILRLSATDCTLIGPGAEVFADPQAYDDTVAAPVRDALATDAARRYTGAWSASGLAVAMRAQGKSIGNLPPGLRTAFGTISELPR